MPAGMAKAARGLALAAALLGAATAAAEASCAADAVIVGKLNLDEFAAGGTGFNPHYGRCCNPWDLERITGGSSSGGAAAVAAGLAAATLGPDTGGSARVPAAYCGVTAIKPSYGLVSLQGVFPRAPPFDSISPIGRSAQDCHALLNVIASRPAVDSTLPLLGSALQQAGSSPCSVRSPWSCRPPWSPAGPSTSGMPSLLEWS